LTPLSKVKTLLENQTKTCYTHLKVSIRLKYVASIWKLENHFVNIGIATNITFTNCGT